MSHDPSAAIERAVSDYLAVSRGRASFASESDYAHAEERAWSALSRALALSEPAPGAPAIVEPLLERG